MHAVIASGGKQYRVKEGQILKLEKIEAEVGSAIDFDKVLAVTKGEDVQLGTPYLEGSKVTGEVIEQGRGKKIKIIKFRRRKHSRTQMGHRQYFTAVKITAIS